MIRMPTWMPLAVALALCLVVCAPAAAADKIKSVSADHKQFVITNQEGKDITLNLADDVRIFLPEGKDGSAKDLQAGQTVSFLWEEKGGKYIATAVLENKGNYKDAMLAQATLKSVAGGGNEFVVTDAANKEWTLQMADKGKVALNNKESKLSDLKTGDKVTLVFEKKGTKLNALGIYSNRR